ncbi:hypothetical protein MHJ85_04685 [Brevibacterium ravenspurgense]|nr:hypothetical protein [Brevibacterium ravenspurgense]
MPSDQMFAHFIDDAAIFPPGLAPLDEAVAGHLKVRTLPADKAIGSFVLTADKLAEASALAGDQRIEFSAVVASAEIAEVDSAELGPNASIAAVELRVDESDPQASITAAAAHVKEHPQRAVWLELPHALVTVDNLTEMRNAGVGLKFRTGGVRKELYPSAEQLLDVLERAVQTQIPFKLTAGLHRAMRYSETVGGEVHDHFGFLNIAAAVVELKSGAGRSAAAEILESDDPQAVAATALRDPSWRENFSSFGSCSFGVGLGTLNELDLVSDTIIDGLNTSD